VGRRLKLLREEWRAAQADVRADSLRKIGKLIAAGEYEEAAGRAEAMIERRPDDPEPRRLLALVAAKPDVQRALALSAAGRGAEAEQVLRDLVARLPDKLRGAPVARDASGHLREPRRGRRRGTRRRGAGRQ